MRSISSLMMTAAAAAAMVAASACSDASTPSQGEVALVDVADTEGGGDAGLSPDAEPDATEVSDTSPEPDAQEDAQPDVAVDASEDVADDGATGDTGDADGDTAEPEDTGSADSDAAETDTVDVSSDVADAAEDAGPPIWEPPASPEEYPFATPGSLISSLLLAAPGEGLSIDGDDTPDNVLGTLLLDLEGLFGFEVDEILQENIDAGLLTIGLGWVGESPVEEGARSEVHILQLDDADDDPLTRDSYYVEAASFVPSTGSPSARFPGVTRGGVFASEQSSFDISLPTGLFNLDLNVQAAVVEASPVFDLLGVEVSQGRIAGVVPGEDLYEALNGFIASTQCACVDTVGPLFAVGDEGRAVCEVPSTSACDASDPCGQIASLCNVIILLVSNSYDQDTGGGSSNDGLSINLAFDAVGITLLGLAP